MLNAAQSRFQKELWDEGTPEASPYGQITGQNTKSRWMHTPQVLAARNHSEFRGMAVKTSRPKPLSKVIAPPSTPPKTVTS